MSNKKPPSWRRVIWWLNLLLIPLTIAFGSLFILFFHAVLQGRGWFTILFPKAILVAIPNLAAVWCLVAAFLCWSGHRRFLARLKKRRISHFEHWVSLLSLASAFALGVLTIVGVTEFPLY